ncbi:restriction endonuclease subunit S [Companilactobacillus kimchii]|nr:restriction endonuclease subunit S [Companilactobacillus kimchii]
MQKLFPKNGEKVPEVRFTNFHDDWEQLPFSKIGTNFSYGLNVSSKEYDGKNKYIRITDIDDSNHKLIEKNLTSPNANLEDIKDYQLKENDLLFARTGASVGKSYLYDNNDGKVFFAGFLIRMEINNKFDKNFVFQNTLTDKYQQFVKITSQRSGQPGINAKEYASFKIFISKSLNEQKMIGKLCFRLNNLINLQQDKLEELKFLKKYLLQNMFI